MTTLAVAVEGFLLAKSAEGRSKYTLRDYTVHLNRFSKRCNGTPIQKVRAKSINEFFVWVRDEFRITHRGNQEIKPRKLSAKTVRNCHAALSSFWKWASEEFELENPFRIPCPKAKTRPVEPLAREDIERMMLTASVRDKALVLVFLDSGARCGEVSAADMEDFELKTGRLYLKQTKGDKPRVVFLGKAARKALWRYIVRKRGEEDGPLFLDRSKVSRMTRNSIRLTINRLGRKCGFHAHPHQLRHTFAVNFLRNGGNVFVLQQLLGHADLSTTKKYLKLVSADLEEAHRAASPADNWKL